MKCLRAHADIQCDDAFKHGDRSQQQARSQLLAQLGTCAGL